MNKFDLPNNFIDNPKTLIRKTKAKLRRNLSTSSTHLSLLILLSQKVNLLKV